jgi:hypothetical protein
MRENRPYGSEGGETGNSTGLSYPYHFHRASSAGSSKHATAQAVLLAGSSAPIAIRGCRGYQEHIPSCELGNRVP